MYLGVDNDPAELGEVQRFLADELGLPWPSSDAPDGDGGGREPSRGGNKRCSNALLRGTGFEFAYPSFREGYRSILAGEGVRHP
ncbi:hypothetical protein D9M72_633970 [compost metagenome]